MTDNEKLTKTRKLNDELRHSLLHADVLPAPRNTRVMFAGALAQDEVEKRFKVAAAAGAFDSFTEDNDPYGEHDCATFDLDGERFVFKIDYYALNEESLSEHPEDPNVTIRVLTLIHADDY